MYNMLKMSGGCMVRKIVTIPTYQDFSLDLLGTLISRVNSEAAIFPLTRFSVWICLDRCGSAPHQGHPEPAGRTGRDFGLDHTMGSD